MWLTHLRSPATTRTEPDLASLAPQCWPATVSCASRSRVTRFWPLRPPFNIQVSRRQDAPMRSIDLLWFHHVHMSPFSITVGELQAPEHATVTNFVSTSDFIHSCVFMVRVPALHTTPQTRTNKRIHVRSSPSWQRFRPKSSQSVGMAPRTTSQPVGCSTVSSTPTKLDAASRRGLPCHAGCGS